MRAGSKLVAGVGALLVVGAVVAVGGALVWWAASELHRSPDERARDDARVAEARCAPFDGHGAPDQVLRADGTLGVSPDAALIIAVSIGFTPGDEPIDDHRTVFKDALRERAEDGPRPLTEAERRSLDAMSAWVEGGCR